MIRYIPFIAAAGGGGGGPQPLHWFEAEDLTPSETVTTGPSDEQALFLAELTVSGVEDYESFTDGEDLTFGTSTVNGVTVTYNSSATVFGTPVAGRFNTTSGGANWLQVGGSLTFLSLTFDVPIAAWGAYLTDVGDFTGQVSMVLYKSGGGTVTHDITHTVAGPSGGLMFVGFVDGIDEYDQIDFVSTSVLEVIGIDDMRVATQAHLA